MVCESDRGLGGPGPCRAGPCRAGPSRTGWSAKHVRVRKQAVGAKHVRVRKQAVGFLSVAGEIRPERAWSEPSRAGPGRAVWYCRNPWLWVGGEINFGSEQK